MFWFRGHTHELLLVAGPLLAFIWSRLKAAHINHLWLVQAFTSAKAFSSIDVRWLGNGKGKTIQWKRGAGSLSLTRYEMVPWPPGSQEMLLCAELFLFVF